MLGLGKVLGSPKPFCAKALLSGAMAVRRHTAAVEKQGKALLATLRPDDKVLVLHHPPTTAFSDPHPEHGHPGTAVERGYKSSRWATCPVMRWTSPMNTIIFIIRSGSISCPEQS